MLLRTDYPHPNTFAGRGFPTPSALFIKLLALKNIEGGVMKLRPARCRKFPYPAGRTIHTPIRHPVEKRDPEKHQQGNVCQSF